LDLEETVDLFAFAFAVQRLERISIKDSRKAVLLPSVGVGRHVIPEEISQVY